MAEKIEPNTLERIIAVVSPRLAARHLRDRMVFNSIGGYTGGRKDRRSMSQWAARGGSADADLLPDLPTLRARSRDLARNAPLAAGALNTVVTNTIGTGLKVQPKIDRELLGFNDETAADRWERDAARVFQLWAGSPACDVTGTQDFIGLQNLAFRSTLESGDVFAVKRFIERPGEPFGYRLQMIEADRVSNPRFQGDGSALESGNTIAAGVERDADGRAVAYWLTASHPGAIRPKVQKWSRLEAFRPSGGRNVLHLFDRRRPGQARGVPYLAPVIESLKELDKYTEAERMAAVVSAMFTVFIKSEGSAGMPPIDSDIQSTGASASDKDIKLASGMILELNKGEDIVTADPGRPNQAFDQFVLAILRQVGAALELPLELVIKHFTASYSASRAAMLEAFKFFKARRQWLTGNFCQPCYEDVLIEAVARGMLIAPGFFDHPAIARAWSAAEWVGPAQGQIDPLKEVNAAEKRVNLGVSTLERETAELTGGDWEQNHTQRVKEKSRRATDGLTDQAAVPAAPPAALSPPPDPDEDPDENDEKEKRQ